MATDVSTRPSRFRSLKNWKVGAGILAVGVVAQTVFLILFADDRTFSKMSVLWVWPATLFLFLLWWLFLSPFSWKVRLTPVAQCLAAGAVFASVYRIDGSDGDMVPRLVYRWEPTPEDRAREYWSQQASVTRSPSNEPAVPASTEPAAEAPAAEPAAEPLIAGPGDWADFRGPQRDGVIRDVQLRTNWAEQPPTEVWRHPVGLGWSSFVVLGDLAITMEQRDAEECVVAYDLQTGSQRWVHGDKARFTTIPINGGDGPHATPVIAGEETYSLGATGLLNCIKTRTGEAVWSHDILKDAGSDAQPAANLEWGMSGSPLVAGDLVIVIPGGNGKAVIAYNRHTGDIAWANGTFPAGYSGPRVEELNGVPQVLVYHGEGLAGFNIADGQQLWNFAWENMPKVNVAQPMKVGDDSLVIGTGYGIGATRVNFTTASGENWQTAEQWKTTRLKLKFNDAVFVDGHIYGLDDGILTCIDVETGKSRWKGGRLGYGQLLAYESKLIILSEEGDLVLAEAQPKRYEELFRTHVLDGTCWNHPAVAHGKLLVRNGAMAACYDVAR